ncbi:unnamed protein product, partial [Ectocarpus sp. 12 AP-2014]
VVFAAAVAVAVANLFAPCYCCCSATTATAAAAAATAAAAAGPEHAPYVALLGGVASTAVRMAAPLVLPFLREAAKAQPAAVRGPDVRRGRGPAREYLRGQDVFRRERILSGGTATAAAAGPRRCRPYPTPCRAVVLVRRMGSPFSFRSPFALVGGLTCTRSRDCSTGSS